jgi:hypothetical protein
VKAQIPFSLVMVVVAIGLVRIALYHWREGTVLIGGALLLAAALRALLSDGRIGMVAIRGRGVDVLLYGCLGLAVLAVALTIQGGPLNQ